jgi:hypothetical protein
MLFSRPYSYASLRLKFQIQTCERAYSLRAVWPVKEVVLLKYKIMNVFIVNSVIAFKLLVNNLFFYLQL